jgi:hypothetical protein
VALRDKLRSRTQPLLEPGEKIEQIFPARAGTNPWLISLLGPFGAIGVLIGWKAFVKTRIIVRTDRALVVFDAGFNGTQPKALLKRLPRDTAVGPLKGTWARTELDGEKIWIHRKFHKDAEAQAVAETP